MENLSSLYKLMPGMLLNLCFCEIDKNVDRRTSTYRRVYVRLLDKALDEYQNARNIMVDQTTEAMRSPAEMVQAGQYWYAFKFTDHMENCISTVRRMLRLVDLLKGNEIGSSFPRIVRRQIDSLTPSLVDIRNLIEHIEKEIKKDAVCEDEPIMLKLADDQKGVVITNQYLSFSQLSTLLKRLHDLGKTMISWRAADDASTP